MAGAPELQEEKNAQSTMLSPVFYWGGRGPDIRISCWLFVSRVVIKGVVAVVALVWPGVVWFKTGQDFADVFDLLKLITDFLLHLDKGERKWWNAQSSIKWAPYTLIQHQWQAYMPLSQYCKQVAKCTPALKWQSHSFVCFDHIQQFNIYIYHCMQSYHQTDLRKELKYTRKHSAKDNNNKQKGKISETFS